MDQGNSRIIFNNNPEAISSSVLKLALEEVAKDHNKTIRGLVYDFVSREKIRELNKAYLNHDYETDIITFDYSTGSRISAQIYICPEVVSENASYLGQEQKEEFYRVVFHGLLHVLGYDDQSDTDRLEMRRMEDACLKRV